MCVGGGWPGLNLGSATSWVTGDMLLGLSNPIQEVGITLLFASKDLVRNKQITA